MKHLILINMILALLGVTAQAAPVSVGTISNINVADKLLSSSSNANCALNKTSGNCDFADANGILLTDTELAAVLTSNAATYATSSSTTNNAAFDLGFNGFNLFNGAGNDLAIFIVGNGTSFGLDVFDTNGTLLNSNTYNVIMENTVFNSQGKWLCVGNDKNTCPNGFALSAVLIDFGNSFAGDIAIGKLSFTLDNAAFSLAGGFHTEASLTTVVPLPLPAVLLSSGLLLLGFTGRRKAA